MCWCACEIFLLITILLAAAAGADAHNMMAAASGEGPTELLSPTGSVGYVCSLYAVFAFVCCALKCASLLLSPTGSVGYLRLYAVFAFVCGVCVLFVH